VPMISELLDGRRPSSILVGVGPGSFTGLRVALAAAHGLSIGWDVPVFGMPSLALLAASAPGDAPLTTAVAGGHGELFVQSFQRAPFQPRGEACSLSPADAAEVFTDQLVIGNGATSLVTERGYGEALDGVPSARSALLLPLALRTLPASPLYVRAPDARPKAA
jgi:tRNA threonylcarbamoyladenosine biosynthesis protein TsaB